MEKKILLAERRRRFNATVARELAAHTVGGQVEQWTGAERRLSTRASWFTDNESLIVVAGPFDDVRDVDLALAYGLYHSGERPLVLVIPGGSEDETASRPTMVRAPWISHPLAIWTYDLPAAEAGHMTRPERHTTQHPDQILAEYQNPDGWNYVTDAGDPPTDHEVFLGDRARWVERLTAWAVGDTDLQPAHRQGYLAWHCQGGLVLKITRTRAGLTLTGGIHYSDPTKKPKPVKITGALTGAESHELIGHSALASARLLEGDDGGRREHRLQAAMAAQHPYPLGLSEKLSREYPAWRPYLKPRGRSYIDFLGCDEFGRLRVVETKIGDDPMLVLQGLDYWIWAMANRAELSRRFRLESENPNVFIDFVVSKTSKGKPAVGPYTAAQSQRLAPAVGHRFSEVTGWESGQPTFSDLELGDQTT